jgi:uncharacterized protein YegL
MDQIPFGMNTPKSFGESVDFAENPEPRVPCVLVLDVSGSMAGEPIRQLNQGLVAFKEELMSDPLASKRVEILIVTFGKSVEALSGFQTADQFQPSTLTTSGTTPMGEAVSLAMDRIEERKKSYRDHGVPYYRPWIFLITDGGPDPGWEGAAARCKQAEENKSFAMFCVGVQGADLTKLRKFSSRDPLLLDGLRFRDLFLWLSRSMKSVSRSTPGEEVPLTNPTGPNGWASV